MTDSDSDQPLAGLRVAHVTTVHDPRDTRIRHKECASLVAAGAQVHLVAPEATEDRGEIDQHGIRLVSVSRRRKHWRLLLSGLEAARRVEKIQPDIVHFHDPELLLMASLFGRRGRKVIYDIHEDTPRQIAGREWIWPPVRTLLSKLIEVGEPFMARCCDGLVMVEDWTSRFPDRPTAIVRNLPMRSEFRARASDTFPNADDDPTVPVVTYLGSITEERGAMDLVAAVNQLERPCRLVLAGPVSDDLAARLRSADEHGRLELPGYLDRPAAVALLQASTIGALLLRPTPAYDVALATKLHEYALAGLPMLLSDTTAHREYAGANKSAVIVNGQDAVAVAQTLEGLLGDAEGLELLASHARRTADEIETWETEAARLIELYGQVA